MQCYINGNWLDADAARIHITERGFRFGDGVFESIRVKGAQALHLPLHLARLEAGLAALQIALPDADLPTLCRKMIARNGLTEGVIRMSVSRGIGSRGYLPALTTPPTLVIETLPLPELTTAPVTLWLSQWRKIPPQCLPTASKTMQGLNPSLARMEAAENNCDEALQLDIGGFLSEASSAALFWRNHDGSLHTPSLEGGALASISRQILLQHLEVTTGQYPLEALREARSVMICNAITGARAVAALQPHGWQWEDSSLAAEANALLEG